MVLVSLIWFKHVQAIFLIIMWCWAPLECDIRGTAGDLNMDGVLKFQAPVPRVTRLGWGLAVYG